MMSLAYRYTQYRLVGLISLVMLLYVGCKDTPKDYTEPLTLCSLYEVSGDRPRFLRILPEGNVAFYGSILAADPEDTALVRYLLEQKKGVLWEYHRDYGVTSADTALVLEGLYYAGKQKELIRKSLQELVDQYFDSSTGGFHSILQYRSKYWKESKPETTALIGWLLSVNAPEQYKEVLVKNFRFLLKQYSSSQDKWSQIGDWFPSENIMHFYMLRFLKTVEKNLPSIEQKEQSRRLAIQLLSYVEANLRENQSVINVAAGILALREGDIDYQKLSVYRKKLSRLLSQKMPEPVLFYWFEDHGGKEFYSCTDRGQIARAWAQRAFRSFKPDRNE